MDFVAFNVVMDDLVLPDGQTYLGLLGSGGPQTATSKMDDSMMPGEER